LILGLAGALLVAAPLAGGGTATVSATGTLTGSGTSYTLKISNTGSEPIRCWRLTLPAGVMATAIGTPPAGWQVGAPGPPPQPALFGQAGTGIPPGGSADFPFTTDTGFPAGLSSTLRISGDCKTDGDAPVTGPTSGGPTTPPPPTAKPCACAGLTARINPKTLTLDQRRNKNRLRLQFDLDWKLTCTAGTGTCQGAITITPVAAHAGMDKPQLTPRDGRVACKGDCGTTEGSFKRFVLLDPGLGFGQRGRKITVIDAVETVTKTFRSQLFVVATCKGKRVTKQLVIEYDWKTGSVRLKTSDLDGNGREDFTGKRVPGTS
jgi:hypothetical protein